MVNNPFKENGEMTPIASINSVYVDDVKAYDLFRPTLIRAELNKYKEELQMNEVLPEDSLVDLFDRLLFHTDNKIRNRTMSIVELFGYRLAKVLSTLLKPTKRSIENRTNWTQEHWDYWSTIKNIYLVGGISSLSLSNIFQSCIVEEFKQRDIKDVTVQFVEQSQHMGLQGLSTLIDNGEILLFDFGQTSIKRARQRKENGEIIEQNQLEPLHANYLEYKEQTSHVLRESAHQLDSYIVEVIISTMNQTGFKGNHVLMSIANYVSNGSIYLYRGGYGKLAYVSKHYQSHLQSRLKEVCKRPINVTLYHDTSAMALLYRHQKDTAVISLGTAFGVAFPE